MTRGWSARCGVTCQSVMPRPLANRQVGFTAGFLFVIGRRSLSLTKSLFTGESGTPRLAVARYEFLSVVAAAQNSHV
jgi:hypothetical protein